MVWQAWQITQQDWATDLKGKEEKKRRKISGYTHRGGQASLILTFLVELIIKEFKLLQTNHTVLFSWRRGGFSGCY